jgi:hypothetical protein
VRKVAVEKTCNLSNQDDHAKRLHRAKEWQHEKRASKCVSVCEFRVHRCKNFRTLSEIGNLKVKIVHLFTRGVWEDAQHYNTNIQYPIFLIQFILDPLTTVYKTNVPRYL